MIRIACLAIGGFLSAFAATAPVRAEWTPYGTSEFQEGEIEQFMQSFGYAFSSCDPDWLVGQFLPNGTIQIIHALGDIETLPPAEWARQYRCRPFQLIRG